MTDASRCNETEMPHVSTKDKLIYFRERFTIKPKYRMKIRPIFCSCLRHQVTPLAWSKIQVQKKHLKKKNNGLLLMVISCDIQYVPPLVQEELPPKKSMFKCTSEKSIIIITLCSLYSVQVVKKAVKTSQQQPRTCASKRISLQISMSLILGSLSNSPADWEMLRNQHLKQ